MTEISNEIIPRVQNILDKQVDSIKSEEFEEIIANLKTMFPGLTLEKAVQEFFSLKYKRAIDHVAIATYKLVQATLGLIVVTSLGFIFENNPTIHYILWVVIIIALISLFYQFNPMKSLYKSDTTIKELLNKK